VTRIASQACTPLRADEGMKGFRWESKSPGLRGVGHHWIEPTPTGCRVTLRVDFRGLLAWLISRLYGTLTQRYIEMEAEGLKRRSGQPST